MTTGTQPYVVPGGNILRSQSLAQRNLAAGGNLLLTTGNESSAAELAEQFSCETAVASADDSASIDGAVQLALDRFGKIDGGVNCMGSVLLKSAHPTFVPRGRPRWADNRTASNSACVSGSLTRSTQFGHREIGQDESNFGSGSDGGHQPHREPHRHFSALLSSQSDSDLAGVGRGKLNLMELKTLVPTFLEGGEGGAFVKDVGTQIPTITIESMIESASLIGADWSWHTVLTQMAWQNHCLTDALA